MKSGLRPPIPAFGLALAALLGACLKDAPLVSPGRVYDPEIAIRQSRYAHLDSIAVLLVDAEDSSRTISLWSGRPDSTRRLPSYVAGEDERLYYRVEGYKEGRGKCYAEVIQEGTSVVTLDTCRREPSPRFREHVHDFGRNLGIAGLPIVLPAGYAGRLEVNSPEIWIDPSLGPLETGDTTTILIVSLDTEILAPGRHEGWVYLRDEKGLRDSLLVQVEAWNTVIFQSDTLRFGNEVDVLELDARVPLTENPAWLGKPKVPWVKIEPKPGAKEEPGKPVKLVAKVDRSLAPSPKGRFHTVFHALGGDWQPIDSITVELAVNDWPGGVHGTVRDWKMRPVAGASVALLALPQLNAAGGTRTDSLGNYAFPGMKAGNYRLVATGADRIGDVVDFPVAARDTAVDLRISTSLIIEAVDLGWKHARMGAAAVIDGQVVAPSQTRSGSGQIVTFPTHIPSQKRYLPAGVPDGEDALAREGVEIAGNASTLFVSYPADSALAVLTDWQGDPALQWLKMPYQPYGLRMNGEELLCAGRYYNDLIMVSRIDAKTYSMKHDTVPVPARQGTRNVLDAGPLVVLHDNHFLVSEESGHGASLSAGVATLPVSGNPIQSPAQWLSLVKGASDFLPLEGLMYIGGAGIIRAGLQSGIGDNRIAGTYHTGQACGRLAGGRLAIPRTFLFAATRTDTVLVFSPEHNQPIGRIVLPEGRAARSIALSNAFGGRVILGDDRKIYLVKPE